RAGRAVEEARGFQVRAGPAFRVPAPAVERRQLPVLGWIGPRGNIDVRLRLEGVSESEARADRAGRLRISIRVEGDQRGDVEVVRPEADGRGSGVAPGHAGQEVVGGVEPCRHLLERLAVPGAERRAG